MVANLGIPQLPKFLNLTWYLAFFFQLSKGKWTLLEPTKNIKKIGSPYFTFQSNSITKKHSLFHQEHFFSSHFKFDCLKKFRFCCFTKWSTERRIANLYEISYQYFFRWLEHWATHFAYFAPNPAHVLIRSRYLFWPLDPQTVSS
jgi:hypothetical protein